MLYAYLAAAIVGLVLLVASLFGAGHDHAAGHDGLDGGEHVSPTPVFLSIRTWTYLLAFGGLTGVLLRLVARAGEPRSIILASAVGIAAAAMARAVIGRASRAGASGVVQSRDLLGKTGSVVVPFASGATGKVRVRVAGGDIDVLATADDGEAMSRHDEVLIVEVGEGRPALVTRSPVQRDPASK